MTAPKRDLFRLGTLGARKNGKATGAINQTNGLKVPGSKLSFRIQMTVSFGLPSLTMSNSSTSLLFAITMKARSIISWQISTSLESSA